MVLGGTGSSDAGLKSRPWLLSYKTSATLIEGRPVNILHDFYIPALSLSVSYDRVAGYFRSSSLAAASQGFSAFVNRGGKMRLVVGADLEPEDVRAILHGDLARLENQLNGELSHPEAWPEDVRNGVTLLGWMVSRGYLEVKVAFRVHGETGMPIPYESMEDGYVHEKWFVLTDEFGNRLYASGTLNESKTALMLNAENIDVHCDWWGETDRLRVEEAVRSFDQVWSDKAKNLRVLTLPEAVRKRLIDIAEDMGFPLEIDGSSAVPKPVSPPEPLEVLRFAVIKDAPKMPGGKLVGMETAPVEPWPHQRVVARRLIETWPYSYLLCDEVGLGKTIEAGLAFRSLYLSGLVRRILVAAPPALGKQWHREMASKLLMPFALSNTSPKVCHNYLFPVEETRDAGSPFDPNLVIVSTGILARKNWAEKLASASKFDVALLDEAHNLRRANPSKDAIAHPDYGNLYSNARDYVRPSTKSLWLATATPVQIHAVEMCDLLAFTDRVGVFQFEPSLTLQFYEVFRRFLEREREGPREGLSSEDWQVLRQTLRTCQEQDPLLWRFLESTLVDHRTSAVLSEWLSYGRTPTTLSEREAVKKVLFAIAPASRVRIRHTRDLLKIYREKGQLKENLPERHICPFREIRFSADEQKAYDDFELYCAELGKRLLQNGFSERSVFFLLSFFRLRFASSFYACRRTLLRRLKKVEDGLRRNQAESEDSEVAPEMIQEYVYEGQDESGDLPVSIGCRRVEDLEWERSRLKQLLGKLGSLPPVSSKMRELLRTLDDRYIYETGRYRQTVIFTRFYDTLVDIVNRLREAKPEIRVGTYSGQGAEYYDPLSGRMVSSAREQVKRLFLEGEVDILVCTDAAAEGLNLQTADMVVNFDLGWNPMKVEQRVGRIDRIGQVHRDVYVLNLCYFDSEEEKVYNRLLNRLDEAGLIVGSQQLTLLPVVPDDFAKLASHEWTLEELEKQVRERMEEKRQTFASMEVPARELYDMYMRLAERKLTPLPVDLAAIWKALTSSRYLKELGCSEVPGDEVFQLGGIQGISRNAALTVSRGLFAKGLKENNASLHFASYGDPVFEAVVNHVCSFPLPECVRRISVPVPIPGSSGSDSKAEMVAFAVITRSQDGARELRLVKGVQDLEGLTLDEEAIIDEGAVADATQTLTSIAQSEFGTIPAADTIEDTNVRAAISQAVLITLIAEALLGDQAASEPGALFLPAYTELQRRLEDTSSSLSVKLPSDLLSQVVRDSLLGINEISLGSTSVATPPRVLLRAALDAIARAADSLRIKKSALTVEVVLEKLESEVAAHMNVWDTRMRK